MKKIDFKEITMESFFGYGSFANMLEPEGFKIGEGAFMFYRDMLRLSLGNEVNVSFSVARVQSTDSKAVISLLEYHCKCGEAILPLNGDIIIGLAPATPPEEVPLDRVEAFRVPEGTMIVLNPGVWHSSPFLYNCNKVNILIGLPERTYASDGILYQISEEERLEITL